MYLTSSNVVKSNFDFYTNIFAFHFFKRIYHRFRDFRYQFCISYGLLRFSLKWRHFAYYYTSFSDVTLNLSFFRRKITLNITFRYVLLILKIWWTNSAFLSSYRHFSTIFWCFWRHLSTWRHSWRWPDKNFLLFLFFCPK